jgi:hypothetical protein
MIIFLIFIVPYSIGFYIAESTKDYSIIEENQHEYILIKKYSEYTLALEIKNFHSKTTSLGTSYLLLSNQNNITVGTASAEIELVTNKNLLYICKENIMKLFFWFEGKMSFLDLFRKSDG